MAGDQRDTEPGVKLAALLEPLLDKIATVEPKVADPPEPTRRRLDERELMGLIFSHLDPENPRVCEGIEFERLMILSESEPEPEQVDPPLELTPSQNYATPTMPEQPSRALDLQALRVWIGRNWADDIATIPSALLDRPELDAAQLELVERAAKRERATLNLRRLHRELALRHLQLFVHACRTKRVRVCRVITGKGIDSRDEPVIKRAVVEWCRGPGRGAVLGWAPQLDRHGEWGTLVLELRTPLVR